MTTFNDLDFGPSHAWLKTRVGQVVGTALIEGARTAPWSRAGVVEEQPVDLYVNPWQGLGGNAANTRASLMYLLRQLEELAENPAMQPVYIGWTTTAAPGAFSVADPHDGWYVVNLAQANYRRYVVTGGIVTVPITVSMVAPAAPASLALWWAGGTLASTYTLGGGAQPGTFVGLPVGSTAPANALSRTGAEGAVPIAAQSPGFTPIFFPNPVPFVRPATVAGLFTGGCRVLDTVIAGGNPIPTGGTFLNSSWVQVYGQHDFAGDCVVTNGLLLLLFQVGQPGVQVWLWNTKLATAAWQQVGSVRYLDNSFAAGTLREVNLERVGWEQVRVRANFSTSGGQWGRQDWRLSRGHYDASFDFWPRGQANTTNFGVDFQLSTAAKIVYNDGSIFDMTVGPTGLPVATTFGHATVFGTAANGPLIGLLYQNPPSVAQPVNSSTTEIGAGDSSGPAAGSFRTYGVFAVPFVTAPNLQAEAESGTLGTGWSSVANAGASGGNEAKCASGTGAGNDNKFGTAWQPQPQNGGSADVYFRLRVTSNVGSALEMTVGLWDVTAGAFVANGSTTLNRTAIPTAYGTNNWFKATPAGGGGCVIPIGHNVQFRAVTALALGTDWFVDEAVLAPRSSAAAGNIGLGDWPADIDCQFTVPVTTAWVPG